MSEALNGTQKAAILMTLIGEEAATNVLKQLETTEVRRITMEIAGFDMIEPSRYEAVLAEFHDMIRDARGLERAGATLARRLLSKARPEEADRIISEIAPRRKRDEDDEDSGPPPVLPDELVSASSRRLSMLLRDEPPQTVALVLSLIPPRKAARLLAGMEGERRIEVTHRMAAIKEIRPNVVERIGTTLLSQLREIAEDPLVPMDGVRTTADALTNLSRSTGQEIVEALEDGHPELSKQLRELLFTFDMLRGLDDRDTQEMLKQVDRAQLALALKGADPDLQMMFFRNMSERASQMLREEMEFLAAPKVSDVEQAQKAIVELALRLEKEGSISLAEQAVAAG
jgi:flagellar motor switch protein FliG